MKSFIQHLLDQKKLKASEVVTLLIDQAKSSLSVPEIVLKHSLLDERMIAQALIDQAGLGMSFKDACARHDAWTTELEKKIAHLVKIEQAPLTRLILEKGYLNPKELNAALDEYLSLSALEEPVPQSPMPQKSPAPERSSDESGEELFSEEFKMELKNSVMRLGMHDADVTPEKVQGELREVLKHLHQLCGILRYSDLQLLEKLVIDAETLVHRSIQSVPKPETLIGISKSISKLIDLVWKAKPHFGKISSRQVIPSDAVVWFNGTDALQ